MMTGAFAIEAFAHVGDAAAPGGMVQERAAAFLPTAPSSSAAAQRTSFAQWFSTEVGNVNRHLVNAEHHVQDFAAGRGTGLHDVMIRLEQARLEFQLAIQVRGRVLEAYQDILRMQV